jgi:iron(III) transport system ATP-binding protein
MSKLVLKNIGKSYGAFGAVSDFSLELQKGEFVSLLGPSGCGKTTTLRMIAGFMPPTSGTIELDGQVISSPAGVVPPENRRMSMIFQSYAIWPNMTVGQNVGFGLEVRKVSRADTERRVNAILDIVQLRALKDRYPSELSGGQQQRVALARAIVVEPEVLLLDEPLSNLDANLREEMRSEIRRLHDEFRITTVYVTHDQSEAMVTSDRIVVMNHGRIEQVDDPVSLYNRPRSRFVAGFIGRTNFLEGKVDGGVIAFPGFTGAAGLFPSALAGDVTFSVRPQNVALHHTMPDDTSNAWFLAGRIVERAYLGEYWDYVVQPDNADIRLRAAAPPLDIHDIGTRVWAEIDPRRIAYIPGAG